MFKYHSNRHVGVLLPIGCLNIRKFRYIGWMLGASKPIFGYWMCSNKFEQVSTDGDYGLAIDYQMSSLSGHNECSTFSWMRVTGTRMLHGAANPYWSEANTRGVRKLASEASTVMTHFGSQWHLTIVIGEIWFTKLRINSTQRRKPYSRRRTVY